MVGAKAMNRSLILFILIIPIIFSIGLTSCVGKSIERDIIANTISTMNKINTYNLNMALSFTNTVPGKIDSQAYSNRWEWKSQRQIDLAKNDMQISMNSGDGVSLNVWDSYIIDSWEYFKTISPPPLPLGSPAWFKTKLLENSNLFDNEAQISPLIELLKTATKVSLIGLENMNGVDCYILQLIPSRQGIADWVTSQNQPAGLDLSEKGTASAKYVKGYQESWIKVWIEKNSYQVKKAEINALFSINQSNRVFQGQIIFSDYNQPISIQVPPEALNAPER